MRSAWVPKSSEWMGAARWLGFPKDPGACCWGYPVLGVFLWGDPLQNVVFPFDFPFYPPNRRTHQLIF